MSNLATLLVKCGLRDYGLEPLVWGENRVYCEHEWGDERAITMSPHHLDESITSIRGGGHKKAEINTTQGQHCRRCSAWRGSLGLEPTPEMFVEHLVEVMREVKRVLRDDGIMMLNLGDSYSQGGGKQVLQTKNASHGLEGMRAQTPNLPSKQLMGIPWRVAFALQADGWWLRNEFPWIKPNCMPSSATDRLTVAHEHWFVLTKSARYYWDADAVRMPSTGQNGQAANFARATKDHLIPNQAAQQHRMDREPTVDNGGRNRRTSDTFNESLDELIAQQAAYLAHLTAIRDNGGMLLDEAGDPLALKFSTKGFPGSHFATFSPDLIEPLIKASVSQRGACPACGAAWGRVVERGTPSTWQERKGNASDKWSKGNMRKDATVAAMPSLMPPDNTTLGWAPRCDCNAGEPRPCKVLDPFAGALTTSLVAERLGHDSTAIEASAEYAAMGAERVRNELGTMFTQIKVIP